MAGEIRIERDGAWWGQIAAHLAVAEHIGASPEQVAAFSQNPLVTPLAAQHGGFLFRNLDGMGFVFELHTLFTPEGWGREVASAAHKAFAMMFDAGAACVVTHEQQGWWRSVPPRSHGWVRAGDWREAEGLTVRLWVLTAQAWAASPATRRQKCRLH